MRLALQLAALSALVSGCASTMYDGKYAWEDGWRQAKVRKIGTASELGGRTTFDCRQKLPEAQVASSQFVVLGLIDFARYRHQVVPVEAGHAFSKGEEVLTNVRRCDPPIARRSK